MRLVVYITAMIIGLFGLIFVIGSLSFQGSNSAAENANSSTENVATAASASPGCDDPSVRKTASDTLADWLNQNLGKGNAYDVHGTFIAEVSGSVEMGSLQGTKQCFAGASLGLKHPGSEAPTIAQRPINLHFLLTGNHVTFDQSDLVDYAAVTADSLLVTSAMHAHPAAESTAE